MWQVPTRNLPRALLLMASQRRAVRKLPFGKLLGTGSGQTFASRDVNWHQYAVVTSWPNDSDAAAFDTSRIVRQWQRIAESQRRIELTPLASRGTWSGKTPFGGGHQANAAPTPAGAPVASITHARIRFRRILTFWRSVRPVAADLAERDGSLVRIAIGEAPIGIQGTFSVWADEASINAFARGPAHRDVIRRRADEGWYAEEIFARFAVVGDVFTDLTDRRPVQ